MNPLDALQQADPARALPVGLDDRAERLLREITASPHPTSGAAAPSTTGATPRSDRRPVVATVVVALAIVVAAVVAIRVAPASFTAPATATSPASGTTDALTEAVYERLTEVATGDVPIREKSQMTWTDARPTGSGGWIDLTGRTLYVAAACEGGGAIAIRVSGRPDVDLRCDGRSTVGPVSITTERESATLDVVTTAGRPRYVAKAMAFAPSATRPSPGTVLAGMTSADGRDQTRTVAANGSALEVSYSCTGAGSLTITIDGGPGFRTERCTGPGTVRSRAPISGTAPIRVRSTGSATWSVAVTAVEPD